MIVRTELSPIVLFVYNRPWHTQQTIEALQKNALAEDSELFIYSDAPKNHDAKTSVDEVREYIKTIDSFRKVTIIERDKNWGLADSIIDGVTSIIDKYGKIIVLEDDLVTSIYFLTYMNNALDRYAMDERVISIHGYVYPIAQELPEAFFLPGADCWGWATWQRGWAFFNSDGQYLLNELKRRKLLRSFDFNGAYPFSKMLKGQIRGVNDSWAIRWYASAFLAGKLTLYPGHSLVHNIGNDESGTHCGVNDRYDVVLTDTPIHFDKIKVHSSIQSLKMFEAFFRKQNAYGWKRLSSKIQYLINRARR